VEKIESATHQFIEIKIQKFFLVSLAVSLPIQYEDVSRYDGKYLLIDHLIDEQ